MTIPHRQPQDDEPEFTPDFGTPDPSRCKYADTGCVEPAEHVVDGQPLCHVHYTMWRQVDGFEG